MHDVSYGLFESFQAAKELISGPRGIQLLLHVHFGLLVFGTAYLLSRRYIFLPLMTVTAVQFANEAIDWLVKPSFRLTDAFTDTANTLLWPIALTLLMWHQRRSYRMIPYRDAVPPRRHKRKAARPVQEERDATSDDDYLVTMRGLLDHMKARTGE